MTGKEADNRGYIAGHVRLSLKSRMVWSYMMTQQSSRVTRERLSMSKQTSAAAAASLGARQIQLCASVWRFLASMPQSLRRQIRRSGVADRQTCILR